MLNTQAEFTKTLLSKEEIFADGDPLRKKIKTITKKNRRGNREMDIEAFLLWYLLQRTDCFILLQLPSQDKNGCLRATSSTVSSRDSLVQELI